MNIEQAINYLKAGGMSDEQIIEVADALTKGAISQLRGEIEQGKCEVNNDYDRGRNYGLFMVTQIIDKYAESED